MTAASPWREEAAIVAPRVFDQDGAANGTGARHLRITVMSARLKYATVTLTDRIMRDRPEVD
jgi:hypothetical protein